MIPSCHDVSTSWQQPCNADAVANTVPHVLLACVRARFAFAVNCEPPFKRLVMDLTKICGSQATADVIEIYEMMVVASPV
jgi:hypothetical protein